mmetsp:Transcript_7246/g.30847  ORF Transcript_7246/g.30847 Transcript_7246/m.30847 type:complete len:201 (-) Transcript_7246:251-853(-)
MRQQRSDNQQRLREVLVRLPHVLQHHPSVVSDGDGGEDPEAAGGPGADADAHGHGHPAPVHDGAPVVHEDADVLEPPLLAAHVGDRVAEHHEELRLGGVAVLGQDELARVPLLPVGEAERDHHRQVEEPRLPPAQRQRTVQCDDAKRSEEGVAAMVEDLAERAAGASLAGLLAVDVVEDLVGEDADGPGEEHPRGHVGVA